MKNSFAISKQKLNKNIEVLQEFMVKNDLDSFYISSFDTFLSEYVPLQECHRYYFTGFTGSVADIIVPAKGRVLLLVDGRYHEQADLEVDANIVDVVKCAQGKSLWRSAIELMQLKQFKSIGLEGDRTPLTYKTDLEAFLSVVSYDNSEINNLVGFERFSKELLLESVPVDLAGQSTEQKLNDLLKNDEALFVTALDSIAWLTNLRAYQLPFQSSFMAKAFATKDHIHLFIDQEISYDAPKGISIHYAEDFNLNVVLKKVLENKKIGKLYLEKDLVNASDYNLLCNIFTSDRIKNLEGGLTPYHASKNSSELKAMQESFKKGDKAIFDSLNWLKNKIKSKEVVTELDFYNATNEIYKETGARAQSFNTIAAVGANSSIMHFSSPSHDVQAKEGEMVLLDSGAFYEGGYATDTTRTIFLGENPTEKHKEIYTLVLKGLLHCQNAVFPAGTMGSAIDSLARFSMREYGYDFAHGTGHGVGINVHEGNFRLSPISQTPIKENHVGSIEPGIYIPGFGGVRLENIVIVKKHPKFSGMLKFEPLVYIGFEEILINRELLNKQELSWLDEYERECRNRSTSFKN